MNWTHNIIHPINLQELGHFQFYIILLLPVYKNDLIIFNNVVGFFFFSSFLCNFIRFDLVLSLSLHFNNNIETWPSILKLYFEFWTDGKAIDSNKYQTTKVWWVIYVNIGLSMIMTVLWTDQLTGKKSRENNFFYSFMLVMEFSLLVIFGEGIMSY